VDHTAAPADCYPPKCAGGLQPLDFYRQPELYGVALFPAARNHGISLDDVRRYGLAVYRQAPEAAAESRFAVSGITAEESFGRHAAEIEADENTPFHFAV
jgi:hypothetical protein